MQKDHLIHMMNHLKRRIIRIMRQAPRNLAYA